MNEIIYKMYLKFTNSKQIINEDLDSIKKEIGDEILNSKFKENIENEEIDLSVYFNNNKEE